MYIATVSWTLVCNMYSIYRSVKYISTYRLFIERALRTLSFVRQQMIRKEICRYIPMYNVYVVMLKVFVLQIDIYLVFTTVLHTTVGPVNVYKILEKKIL